MVIDMLPALRMRLATRPSGCADTACGQGKGTTVVEHGGLFVGVRDGKVVIADAPRTGAHTSSRSRRPSGRGRAARPILARRLLARRRQLPGTLRHACNGRICKHGPADGRRTGWRKECRT